MAGFLHLTDLDTSFIHLMPSRMPAMACACVVYTAAHVTCMARGCRPLCVAHGPQAKLYFAFACCTVWSQPQHAGVHTQMAAVAMMVSLVRICVSPPMGAAYTCVPLLQKLNVACL